MSAAPRYYEYRVEELCLSNWTAPQLQDWLNTQACEGWRLVAIENPYFFFERQELPQLT